MRHLKKKVTLDRKSAARRSMVANLAQSLILLESVMTTKAKARAVKSFTEKLITVAKKNNLSARRDLIRKVYSKNAVNKLMDVLGPRYAGRKGGYTRLTLVSGSRAGDGAERAVVELLK